MTTTKIHASSPVGTHPSYASPGRSEMTCDECGKTRDYNAHLGERYEFNGVLVGFSDACGDGGDFCPACWEALF